MPLRARRVWLLVSMLAVVAVAVLAIRWDAHRRLSRVEQMMAAQGRAIADIVAESSLHGLSTFNQWRQEVSLRLLNNALWLARCEAEGGLPPEGLDATARALGLLHIRLVDGGGRVVAAGGAEGAEAGADSLPEGFLAPLLAGQVPVQVLGFRPGGAPGARRFAAAAARPAGGAVVVDVAADSLWASRRQLGPGHLVRSLGEGHGIRYVVIQDRDGIQASSTSEIEFLAWDRDPRLAPLARGDAWATHEYVSPLGPVLEVARVADLPQGPVLLRVGMDPSLLLDFRRAERRHGLISLGVLLVSLALVSSLLLAWQRQGRLDREVVKISRRLAAREAEARRMEKLAAMGSLASGVAHQIRNPLNSIHLIGQVLARNAELPGELRTQAGHIKDESARIERIVQQFLEFTRPREPRPETVDLGSLVRETVAIQEAAAQEAGVTLTAYAPGGEARVDRQFVIEVLENLVRNAVQASPPGGKVLVSAVTVGEYVEIVVADDGPGVRSQDRERIFDLYYTTRAQGTGVGLSLSAQMVAAMGGEIRLAEEAGLDGRGARFVVRLPRRPEPQERTEPCSPD